MLRGRGTVWCSYCGRFFEADIYDWRCRCIIVHAKCPECGSCIRCQIQDQISVKWNLFRRLWNFIGLSGGEMMRQESESKSSGQGWLRETEGIYFAIFQSSMQRVWEEKLTPIRMSWRPGVSAK